MKQSPRKIRFTKTLATSRQTFRCGHEYDIAGDEASEYIAKGIAETVKTASPKSAAAKKG